MSAGTRLEVLENQINSLSENQGQMFGVVYNAINDGNNQSCKASTDPANRHLNRYANIVAYDKTRVKVKPNKYNFMSDYINANYINGYKKKNMYIASQGPVPDSFNAFWQMVWDENSPAIIMVTNEVEGGKLKCHRYWPEREGDSFVFGEITVTMTAEKVFPVHVEREFTLHKENASRSITQFQYTAWPDHGVPNTTNEILKFRQIVRRFVKDSKGPMVAHCSAGVGRTGTFIGLDRFLDSCSAVDANMSVLDIVKDMRKSRNFMVQALAQFHYLYHACYDGLGILIQKASRELQLHSKTDEEREEAIMHELELDIAEAHKKFTENLLMHAPKGVKIRADVKSELPKDSYTADKAVTQAVSPQKRLSSLVSSQDQWLKRGNVPLSPEGHGYKVASAGLEPRLQALSESRSKWTNTYADACKTWQSAQDHDGVYYDIGHQLSSIESRVESLAAAEAAWRYRGSGQVSYQDQLRQDKVTALEQRLRSLQFTVVSSEERWKARGDGMRGESVPMEEKTNQNTVSYLGGLTDRLGALQMEQTAYQQRDNWNKYETDKFHQEVKAVYEEAERIQHERAKADATEQATLDAQQKAAIEADQARRDRENTEAAKAREADERKQRFERLERIAVKQSWNAETARKERVAAQELEEHRKAAEEAARAKLEAEKLAEKQKKEASKKKASKNAKNFLM